MKFIKGLLVAFVVSCLFAVSNASAFVKGYTNVIIPKYRGIWNSESQEKLQNGYQYLLTTGTREDGTSEIKPVEARTKRTTGSLDYSDWKSSPNDVTIDWGDQNNSPATYELQIRAKSSSNKTIHYFGIWYFDR